MTRSVLKRRFIIATPFHLSLLIAGTLVVATCSRDASSPSMNTPSTPPTTAAAASAAGRDVHSFAIPADARVTHVSLDLHADFAAKRLTGTATLDLQRAPTATKVVLDTQDLEIRAVTDAAGHALQFTLGDADKFLGRPLTVALSADTQRITIAYATSPDAAALQWLDPEQTAGKRHPYLFSQGEAILTRTWIPTQDSPGIRQTYDAKIVVPAGLHAVMSAQQLTPDGVAVPDGVRFEFRLTHPIPPYLIALAIGDLAFRSNGPRTGVYTEPAVLDSAAYEFGDLERMVQAAESLGGPYRWDRYDVIVLPPSFPFGGMENPRLTFATPTVLAGDRSLTSLVAHELAHSWSGNLVTNATWNDFWLNEGFTVYFERRIMEALYGQERAAMLEVIGRQDLLDEIKRLSATPADTRLHLDLAGRNPDDGTTNIAYEKGAAFLKVIEAAVGRERFDPYLRGYFDRHAFTSLTTDDFLADLRANLIKDDRALDDRLRINDWVFQPGLPDNAVQPSSTLLDKVDAQLQAFAKGTPAGRLDTKGWVTQQWQHFLMNLPESLTVAQMEDLDSAFAFSRQGNSEVLFVWLRLAVAHHYQPAMPALEHFLTSQGRRKFLKPLYEDLMRADWGKPEAKRLYQRARPLYHAVSRMTLDEIVK
jgi:leukotriene-A4 hydrolase